MLLGDSMLSRDEVKTKGTNPKRLNTKSTHSIQKHFHKPITNLTGTRVLFIMFLKEKLQISPTKEMKRTYMKKKVQTL